jgi:hypothetical protein
LALALILSLPDPGRADDAVGEYEVKAAFIFNIAKYAKWPATAFSDANAPLVIGILGKDPFGGVLDRVVQIRQIEGRRVVIRRGTSAAEMRGCHLVFIADGERDRIASHCEVLENFGVLTVGDAPQRRTAIVFYLDGSRLSFSVWLPALDRAQVQISAKLLKLAKEVTRQPGSATARIE